MAQRDKILIVDDVEFNRSLLVDMLSGKYETLEAENGFDAITLLEKYYGEISIVLLDIVMPIMDGFEVLTIMKQSGWLENIPVITISSETSTDYINKAFSLGATDYISRPFEENTVQHRVKNTIMFYNKQEKLEKTVAEQYLEKEQNNALMVELLSNIVEFRNGDSGQHVLNIRTITELLLHQLTQVSDRYRLSPEEIGLIVNASSLHDVGKISIPEEILNKPGKLTPEEFEIIKQHCIIGEEILRKTPRRQNEALVQVARGICRWHHERYDGSGYPDGLKGDDIPIAAQVVAMADVYDALTSTRVYKPAYSHQEALQMIAKGECGAFNPQLLQCLFEVGDRIEKTIVEDEAEEPLELHADTFQGLGEGRLASGRTLALLEQERIKYQFFASMSKEIQFEWNESTDILTFSEWGAKQLGVKELIIHPRTSTEFQKVIAREDYMDLHNRLHRATLLEPVVSQTYLLHIGGEVRWYKAVARPLWVGEDSTEVTGAIGKFIDVHEEYTELNSFKRLAEEDFLTKLQNHRTARKEIETKLACEKGKKYAMLLVDLDNFKLANDQYGHMFGDDVLKHVANLITRNIRGCDTASRIGGDEFLTFISYQGNVEPMIKRIFHALAGVYRDFSISVSMGISLFPKDGNNYDELFHCADQSLYAAKKSGKSRLCFYDESVKGSLSVLSPIDNAFDAIRTEALHGIGYRE